ncbi:MAG: hypothetical protein M1819_003836 [Sarea resinae]|nr:MAG: hypothetical protein M1819_003836 [Sarea resinae]
MVQNGNSATNSRELSSSYEPHTHRQPPPRLTNGSLAAYPPRPDLSQRRNNTFDSGHSSRSVQGENGLLSPTSHKFSLGRKDSNLSGVGSEADSLLDLYGARSGPNSMDFGDRRSADGGEYLDADDPESSNWIHRDKLARIEIQELQQAGIHIRGDSRAGSRLHNRKEKHREHSASQQENEDLAQTNHEGGRQRIASPVPADEESDGEPMVFDVRTPEEIAAAADQESRSNWHLPVRQPGRKASYSRIPLPRSSPMPIPLDYLERHTPLSRSRNNSGAYGSTIEGPMGHHSARSRSRSVGSQVLLDDGEEPDLDMTNGDTPSASPKKARTPGKATPGGRKASANRNASGQKPRSRSAAASRELRGGSQEGNRPGTSHAKPEGDPPWLASMYKPDPRLPPDQQLLPTHAKRLQQEQWEREGKPGSVYDRDFNTLNIYDREHKPPTGEATDNPDEESAWPLRAAKSPTPNGRPGTSGTEHGGYKTIPNVARQPSPAPVTITRVPQPVQTQDSPPKKEPGGCGCCVVM